MSNRLETSGVQSLEVQWRTSDGDLQFERAISDADRTSGNYFVKFVSSTRDYGGSTRISLPSPLLLGGLEDDEDLDNSNLEKQFQIHADIWQKETGHLSKMKSRIVHPSHLRIIGLGKKVVPFILCRMKETKEDWFSALSAITGENPVTDENRGYVDRMIEDWLKWAKDQMIGV